MQVHVYSSEGEAKFWVRPRIELAENRGSPSREIIILLESSREKLMKSQQHGVNASAVEVTNTSSHGFWLWLAGRELFVPFGEFPWFAEASIAKITHLEWPSDDHLYWPDLDIDLSVRSIEHPEEFPLKYQDA